MIRRALVLMAVVWALTLGVWGFMLQSESGSADRQAADEASAAASAAASALAAERTAFGWVASISTIAGDGRTGLQDGASGEARFADPYGLAFGGTGTLYVSDGGENNRIRRLSTEGQVDTLAGGAAEGLRDGRGAAAAFHTPSGLAIDAAGNLYVADTGNHAIRKVTPDGSVTTLAGNGTPGFRDGPAAQALFNGPLAVAVDGQGQVWVADSYNDRIRVIGSDGQVRTVAGGDRPGWADGPAGVSRLDTPSGLAIDDAGTLWIADTRNDAIRRIGSDGQLVTAWRSTPDAPADKASPLRRPLALAVTADGHFYVAVQRRGSLLQIAPDGRIQELLAGGAVRFARPTALVLDGKGHPMVADAAGRRIHHVQAAPLGTEATVLEGEIGPAPDDDLPATQHRWPLAPQDAWHEVVGTLGEVRGDGRGEHRDHLHDGLDVRGDVGQPVLAMADAKVDSPLAGWSFGDLGEGLALGPLRYIHVRVGRNARGEVADVSRFQLLRDEAGQPERVRLRRGTRFAAGDVLGSINPMAHVHLSLGAPGFARNPMQLGFAAFVDRQPPRIDAIELFDAAGQPLAQRAGGRLLVPREGAGVQIVVDAWDQVDGNGAQRRLGLHTLGYRLLRADGQPAPGFDEPRMTLDFSRLPVDDTAAVQLVYAADSGITAHGTKRTRFRYVVSNALNDGQVAVGRWLPDQLPAGDYTLRIVARDAAGNLARRGADLAVRVQ